VINKKSAACVSRLWWLLHGLTLTDLLPHSLCICVIRCSMMLKWTSSLFETRTVVWRHVTQPSSMTGLLTVLTSRSTAYETTQVTPASRSTEVYGERIDRHLLPDSTAGTRAQVVQNRAITELLKLNHTQIHAIVVLLIRVDFFIQLKCQTSAIAYHSVLNILRVTKFLTSVNVGAIISLIWSK